MVVFTAAARADVEAAHDWYEKHSPDAASRFRDAIQFVVARIEAKPRQFPAAGHRTRRALLPRFPYIVLFRETEVAVVVVAVFHTRRDPQEWSRRLT
jgi:toxin ParE1/3/4